MRRQKRSPWLNRLWTMTRLDSLSSFCTELTNMFSFSFMVVPAKIIPMFAPVNARNHPRGEHSANLICPRSSVFVRNPATFRFCTCFGQALAAESGRRAAERHEWKPCAGAALPRTIDLANAAARFTLPEKSATSERCCTGWGTWCWSRTLANPKRILAFEHWRIALESSLSRHDWRRLRCYVLKILESAMCGPRTGNGCFASAPPVAFEWMPVVLPLASWDGVASLPCLNPAPRGNSGRRSGVKLQCRRSSCNMHAWFHTRLCIPARNDAFFDFVQRAVFFRRGRYVVFDGFGQASLRLGGYDWCIHSFLILRLLIFL